jgi:hypothetical protein
MESPNKKGPKNIIERKVFGEYACGEINREIELSKDQFAYIKISIYDKEPEVGELQLIVGHSVDENITGMDEITGRGTQPNDLIKIKRAILNLSDECRQAGLKTLRISVSNIFLQEPVSRHLEKMGFKKKTKEQADIDGKTFIDTYYDKEL